MAGAHMVGSHMAGSHIAGAHMAGVHMAGAYLAGTCHTHYRSHRLNLFYSCLRQKSSESFSIFFSLKNINLGAHFLLLTFFDNINF